LVFPSKKGLAASLMSVDSPKENPSLTPVFTPGFSKKALTRAMFNAARNGKNKLVSTIVAYEIETVKKGALSSLPNNNENPILELQGAF
jgi:hypothetical protein